MALFLALAVSLAAQAAPPPAADWRTLGTHQNGTAFAYNRASIRREPEAALARIAVRATLSSGRYAVSEIEIRCAANEARVATTQNYAADGTPGTRDDVPVAFETIPSGSFVEVIRNDACSPG